MNVFCSGSKFFQKTSFFEFFFGVLGVSLGRSGFDWLLSFVVFLGAKELNMAFLLSVETFHSVATICGFYLRAGRAYFSPLFPMIGSGPIRKYVNRVGVWSRYLDSQEPREQLRRD